MRSPLTALLWEIWRRNRRAVWLVIGIILFAWLFNLVLPDSFRATTAGRARLMAINCLLMAGSFLLVFGMFNYTELNPQKEWTGFPYRLFSLPVSTWRLPALPTLAGVAALEAAYLAWLALVFGHSLKKPEWIAVLLGAYMVFYQTILWSLAGFRILRIVVLGLVGTSFVGVASLPLFAQFIPSLWLSEKILIPLVTLVALAAFVMAWISLARQRCGGGRRRNRLRALIGWVTEVLPERKRGFRSPAAAQFWFEWRRIGILMPALIGALLVLVIGPISWHLRAEPGAALRILAWTLAMPVILAMVAGWGFSRPDFWSRDLALPPFVASRPLATGEMVVAKMKVAALSAATSWLLVLAFLSLWLPLWADLSPLSAIRIGFWMVYGHSMLPQYLIAALGLVAGMFLTWRFLVGELWVGLSGNRAFYLASAAGFWLTLLLGIIGLAILLDDQAVRAWIHEDPNRLLAYLEWSAAFAVIGKFWVAARSWRNISGRRVCQYLLLWSGATLLLIALAILLWAGGALSPALTDFAGLPPMDVYRLRNLLILAALLTVPLARLGFAPAALAQNRHR